MILKGIRYLPVPPGHRVVKCDHERVAIHRPGCAETFEPYRLCMDCQENLGPAGSVRETTDDRS